MEEDNNTIHTAQHKLYIAQRNQRQFVFSLQYSLCSVFLFTLKSVSYSELLPRWLHYHWVYTFKVLRASYIQSTQSIRVTFLCTVFFPPVLLFFFLPAFVISSEAMSSEHDFLWLRQWFQLSGVKGDVGTLQQPVRESWPWLAKPNRKEHFTLWAWQRYGSNYDGGDSKM